MGLISASFIIFFSMILHAVLLSKRAEEMVIDGLTSIYELTMKVSLYLFLSIFIIILFNSTYKIICKAKADEALKWAYVMSKIQEQEQINKNWNKKWHGSNNNNN